MTVLGGMISVRLEIIVEPDGNEYHAYCPALKGLHTCGLTKEEALKHAENAAIAYIESLLKHGEPLPVGQITREPTHTLTIPCGLGAEGHITNVALA